MKTLYITRSDLAGWTDNQPFNQCPLAVANGSTMTLMVRDGFGVPKMLRDKCRIAAYRSLKELLTLPDGIEHVYTSFDFPCMMIAVWLKFRHKVGWTIFLWDPPCLGHRDKSSLLRGAIDFVWRRFARLADRIVLNIHEGLLGEMKYRPPSRQQVIHSMNGICEEDLHSLTRRELPTPEFDVGIMGRPLEAKGKNLVQAAFRDTSLRVKWIWGLPKEEAQKTLGACRVLVLPYLPVPSLKWNYALKLFEYMASGRPVLAADNPGVCRIIRDGENGVLFKSGDADDLRRKAIALLQDEERRTAVAAEARKNAAAYSWGKINGELGKKIF